MSPATTRSRLARAGATLVLLGVAGCATAQPADRSGTAPERATHTMPDGTVMEGETHVHDDSHDHGESAGGPGPSPAARMVCAGQVVEDVVRIMDVDELRRPESAWSSPTLTCTFDLEEGPLVLSVHDVDDETAGMAHFQSLRTSRPGAEPLGGVYSLGLPAYETPSGTVAFVKDAKTLEVDATGLVGRRFGIEASMDRTEVAYAVATSVLACWTDHA